MEFEDNWRLVEAGVEGVLDHLRPPLAIGGPIGEQVDPRIGVGQVVLVAGDQVSGEVVKRLTSLKANKQRKLQRS